MRPGQTYMLVNCCVICVVLTFVGYPVHAQTSTHASFGSTVYCMGGYGSPMDLRAELGYVIGDVIGLGLAIDMPLHGHNVLQPAIGGVGRVLIPCCGPTVTPFIIAAYTSTPIPLDYDISHTSAMLGVLYTVRSGVHLRAEIGAAVRETRGGLYRLFGNNAASRTETGYAAWQLSVELSLAHLSD